MSRNTRIVALAGALTLAWPGLLQAEGAGQQPAGQMPMQQGQMPMQQGRMPMMQGQMPMMQGQMPMMQRGQMPMMQGGQMPMMQGHMPMMQGQMPMMQHGQMPMMQGGQMPMMQQGETADDAPATAAFKAANARMHQDMAIAYSGDADVDFVKGMIPHRQGAIDMAKVVLAFGKDPEVKKLAEAIVQAQEAEIAQMRAMLERLGK